MLKKISCALSALTLMGLAGCSGADRTADNIPRPILNSERMNSDATTTTDTTVGSNPNDAAGTAMNTDAASLSTAQSAAARATPSPSVSPSGSHSTGAGTHSTGGGTTGTSH